MKLNSIKSRLMLMTLTCILSMALLVASQHFFTQQLVILNQQRELLLRLGQDLLQMRRHEKDFLLRHQLDYQRRFEQQGEVFAQRLQNLSIMSKRFVFTEEIVAELANGMHEYQQRFQQLVYLQTRIGLTNNSGLQGQLKRIEATLSREPSFSYGGILHQQLTNAKLAARNYMLTADPFYQQEFNQSVEEVRELVVSQNLEAVELLIDQYHVVFASLFNAMQALGLTHNDGLQGEFRRQAHLVEAKLRQIDLRMYPLIEAQEYKVKTYSLAIAVITSIALVLLLVRSFATFHRAFANFVMFFHRCKRQYPTIDLKQLGFAEFRSLAVLANEMVENRKATERRLASAEAELKRLQDAS